MKTLDGLRRKSHENTYKRFASLLDYNPKAKLLDLGCHDGTRIVEMIRGTGIQDIVGVDVKDWSVPFEFVKHDLGEKLPFEDKTFDVVTASHIIEHVSSTDLFVKEIHRVLKVGGYTIIGTPNLANGQTIMELLMNRQPYIAYVSDYFALRRNGNDRWKISEGNLHRRLFTMEGLIELLTYYKFRIEEKETIGYGRFFFGRLLRGLYAANLIVKARRMGEWLD